MSDPGANAGKPAIAIPRVLWWFRLWPFWKAFFEGIGCRVVTNDPARPTPHRHERASTIVEEACFPIQLLIDRTLAIAAGAEAIFLPRLISVDRRGIMCPRFSAVPDIVRMVLEDKAGCQPAPLLSPVVDARLGRRSVRDAYLAIAAQLGVSAAAARKALRHASEVQERFEKGFEIRLNTLPTPEVFEDSKEVTPGESPERGPSDCLRVALLGHPYIAYDWEFNLDIVGKLRSLGLWVVPGESLDRKKTETSVRRLDKNVYWTSGREALGAALSSFENGGVEGVIYLSCFKCGVDGLLGDVVRWAARHQSRVAYLALTLDGHDNEMGLATRLEAFADIVRRRASRPPESC